MQSFELDQYWPNTKRPLPSSGLADGTRAGQEPQQIQSSGAPRDRRTPLIWGGLGFGAGMFVWHMIGFWSFVSHVAFNGDQRAAATAINPEKQADRRAFGRGMDGKPLANHSAENCIALAIDRMSGAAAPGPCAPNGKPLADAGHTRRRDIAFARLRPQDSQTWAGVTAVESEVAIETIDESAFDLTIRPGP